MELSDYGKGKMYGFPQYGIDVYGITWNIVVEMNPKEYIMHEGHSQIGELSYLWGFHQPSQAIKENYGISHFSAVEEKDWGAIWWGEGIDVIKESKVSKVEICQRAVADDRHSAEHETNDKTVIQKGAY